jgi:hypothetical protein
MEEHCRLAGARQQVSETHGNGVRRSCAAYKYVAFRCEQYFHSLGGAVVKRAGKFGQHLRFALERGAHAR